MTAPPSRDGPRVNEEIRAPQVRLIDQDGEMQGVMSAREALFKAQNVGLDLLEISPNADLDTIHRFSRWIEIFKKGNIRGNADGDHVRAV